MTFACAAQGDRLRAAGRIITNGHTGAARTGGSWLKGDGDRAGGSSRQGTGTNGTSIGLGKVARISATQADAADGQGCRAAIFEGDRLRGTGSSDHLVAEGQAAGRQAHRWRRGHPCATEGHRLRAAAGIVGDADTGAARAIGRWSKGDTDRTGAAGRQGAGTDGAIVGLRKVPAVSPGQADTADAQGGIAIVGQHHRLGGAGRVDLLVTEAQAARTQAHRWGGRCRTTDEVVEDIGGRSLDPRVGVVGTVIIEPPTPLDRPGGKHPRAAGCRVEARVRVRVARALATAHHWRIGEHGQPRRGQAVIPHLVIFIAHNPRHRGAVHKAGSRIDPVRGVLHDIRIVLLHLVLVHHSDESVFWHIHRIGAPVCRHNRVVHVPHGIGTGGCCICSIHLVADLDPVGYPRGIGLETDLPVYGVSREEGDVDTGVDGVLHIVAHAFGPVLVMAGAIAVVGVEGTVKGDLGGLCILIHAPVGGVIIQTEAAPLIVGLVGGHAGLEHDVLVAPVITDNEGEQEIFSLTSKHRIVYTAIRFSSLLR
jgi:hypothetical protein